MSLPTTLAWPPAYSVKKHPRARRVRLRASLQRGLEFIVPKRFNLKEIPKLLDQHRLWIEKQLQDLRLQPRAQEAENLPQEIEFKSVNKAWKVYYLLYPLRMKLVVKPEGELLLKGDLEDKKRCKEKLAAWIRKEAEAVLLPYLQHLSLELGLPYAGAKVRRQSSRWGSCSSKKVLSLNYKLLFFPPALMRHVLTHELCHTVQMNHSEKFWQEVARHDPNWREHRRALRKAGQYIPAWLI